MARTGGIRTKGKVLDAAVRLFGTAGYAATSLDELAADVGIRKQTLLYYFASKDELLTAAALEAAAGVYGSLDGALKAHDPGGLDRLPVFIEAVAALARDRPEVFGLIREVARAGPPLSDRVATALRPLVDSAVEWLEKGMADGVIRRQNPRVALLNIYSAVIGHLTEGSVQRALLDAEARGCATAELVAFLRASLAPDGAARALVPARSRPGRGGRSR
jgi:AcrR family transcriptional regulator